jgi:hypothetical protein
VWVISDFNLNVRTLEMKVKGKCKDFPVISYVDLEGGGMLGFHPYFDIRHNLDGRVVSSTCRPHFSPKEIPWYSFLLEADWTPGLMNANGRIRSL